jgi:hypothetical protein
MLYMTLTLTLVSWNLIVHCFAAVISTFADISGCVIVIWDFGQVGLNKLWILELSEDGKQIMAGQEMKVYYGSLNMLKNLSKYIISSSEWWPISVPLLCWSGHQWKIYSKIALPMLWLLPLLWYQSKSLIFYNCWCGILQMLHTG